MTVEELSTLHRRYIDVSERFKSAWTYHQFLAGVGKVFPSAGIGTNSLDFEAVFNRIKVVSGNLNVSSVDTLRADLTTIEKDLEIKLKALSDQDNRVPPSLLRQFFGQVESYDEKILSQLVRFYLVSEDRDVWPSDRIDKADFLLTKIGEGFRGLKLGPLEQDPGRLSDLLRSLWLRGSQKDVSEEEVSDALAGLSKFRQELVDIPNLDGLNDLRLVQKYRSFKHELNWRLFEPRIAQQTLEINLQFGETVQRLYSFEERRIAAEYGEVFELERGASTVDDALDDDLKEFHRDIERFEQHLEHKNVRLDELAYIRDRVRNLLPRLRGSGEVIGAEQPMTELDRFMESGDLQQEVFGPTPTGEQQAKHTGQFPSDKISQGQSSLNRALAPQGIARHADSLVVGDIAPKETLKVRTAHAEIIGDELRRLLRILHQSDWESAPTFVAATPEVQHLRLLPRDVVAFRRLHRPELYDRELEQFLLETAAVRIRINAEAEDIVALLERGGNRDNPLFEKARLTSRLADQLQVRFGHFITQALQDGAFSESQTLQFHRMRLLRDYSGLWLLAFS